MTTVFNIEFEYKPVGQGLFYTGIFEHNISKKRFSLVYDCGVKSKNQNITNEITNFKNELNHAAKLDLLILSHFHNDHINHVENLLKQTNGANTVVLPFLTEDELFLAFFENLKSSGDPIQQNFFFNPVGFFRELGVEKIIFIHPDDDNHNPDAPFEIEPSDVDPDGFNFQLKNELIEVNPLHLNIQKEKDVLHCYGRGSIVLNSIWEFKFFNKVRNPKQVAVFKQDVDLLLKKPNSTLYDISHYFISNPKKAMSSLKKLYNQNFKINYINDTSLCVLNIPKLEFPHKLIKSWILGKHNRPPILKRKHKHDQGGILLVGDLKIDNDCLDQMVKKWSWPLRNIVVYSQIPHHGAKNHLKPRFLSDFSKSKYHIVNFGLGNQYNHPSVNIINMILQGAARVTSLYENNQLNGVKIKYKILT